MEQHEVQVEHPEPEAPVRDRVVFFDYDPHYCWVWRRPSDDHTGIRFNDYYHVRRGLHVGLYYWRGLRRDGDARHQKN